MRVINAVLHKLDMLVMFDMFDMFGEHGLHWIDVSYFYSVLCAAFF